MFVAGIEAKRAWTPDKELQDDSFDSKKSLSISPGSLLHSRLL